MALSGDRASWMQPRWLLRGRGVRQGIWRSAMSCRSRVLGSGRELQHREARRDQSYGRMHGSWRSVHRLHDAGIPRQVLAVLQDAAGVDRVHGDVAVHRGRDSSVAPAEQSPGEPRDTMERARRCSKWLGRRRRSVAATQSCRFLLSALAALGLQESGTSAWNRGPLLGRHAPGKEGRVRRQERHRRGHRSQGAWVMTDAQLWAAWRLWLIVAAVVVVIAAALLITIWMTARAIYANAVRALAAARKIQAQTAPIWALQTSNEVAQGLLDTVQSIGKKGAALAEALESRSEERRVGKGGGR